MPVIRIITTCAAIALSFAAARPAAAYSLRTLEPQERTAMLRTCMHLDGQQRSLCQQVVDDEQVIAVERGFSARTHSAWQIASADFRLFLAAR
jgi:hypothetical protein